MKRLIAAQRIALMLVPVALLVGASKAAWNDADEDEIEGVYAVVGKEKKADYTGVATIRKNGEEQYLLQVAYAVLEEDGSPHALGQLTAVGIREGNTLSFGWTLPSEIFGVNVYRIEKGGVLAGKYTSFPKNSAVKTETMRRIGPLPKVGAEAKEGRHGRDGTLD